MNSKQNSRNLPEFSDESEADNTLSIDEFFKQLEAKEKDLDISSDLVIEIDESATDGQDISDFFQVDFSAAPNKPEPAISAFEDNSIHSTGTSNLQSEILNLQNQIARMETERVELFEISRRRQNDFDNYKNRTERERGETFRNQLSNLATQMLPVVDNLNRALDSSGHITEESTQDFKQFFEGIFLVSQQLNEILAEMGVQPIVAVGEPFNPHYHEAVATEITDEFPPQTVISELLRGYRIGDKVIRPSMVKVSVSATAGNFPELSTAAE
ncbi:MAG TPA: nucleotide exchange factor GrpE [Pyrinomonadaceae bacterium]|nr:nucleotide exchange factor GrpE [Pyrinomonadaceae bacterium]